MLKLIGGAVLCGWALYGLVKYMERPMVKVVIHATPPKESASDAIDAAAAEEASATGDAVGGDAAPTEPTSAAA